MASSKSCLQSNLLQFCACCGSILPLPVGNDPCAEIQCVACDNSVPISLFNGQSSSTKIVFNNVEQSQQKSTAKIQESMGPVVERKCWKCAFDKMYYKTLQTRSADEGQTVFYYCVKCGAQENENS